MRTIFRRVNRYVGNLAPMTGVFPDYPAPVIRAGSDENWDLAPNGQRQARIRETTPLLNRRLLRYLFLELSNLGGESYGPVTITKTITIDCAGTRGHISLSAITGITVNAGPADKVIIRNLHLSGVRSSAVNIGAEGIRYIAGGELEVDNVFIATISQDLAGISVEKTAFGVLIVKNSTFSRMDFGIKMQATSGSISASVSNSSFNNLANTGIEAGKGTYVTVSDSKFTAIYGYGIKSATSTSYASATNNVFSSSYIGMSANVSGAKINANGNTFYGNSKAFNVAAGGVFFSGGDNKIDVNPGNPPTGALTNR